MAMEGFILLNNCKTGISVDAIASWEEIVKGVNIRILFKNSDIYLDLSAEDSKEFLEKIKWI